MARRAASALTAILAFAAIAVPAALVTVTAPQAAAATSGAPTVAFTRLNPQWASPGTTISVTGSVKNASPVTRRLVVQLFDYSVPISSVSELQQSAASDSANGRAPIPLPNTIWQSPMLRPGAAASWSFRVPVSAMGLTSFGVYLLNAQVSDLQGHALNQSVTYVPYVPAKNSPYGSSIPAAQKISWVWPLIDQPLLSEPWHSTCTDPQA